MPPQTMARTRKIRVTVWERVAIGMQDKEIARELRLPHSIVKRAVADLIRIHGVRNRLQLALLWHGVHPGFIKKNAP